ncbi:unnamed protein product [Amoebophrya sp. A25]|nr:unnamed protein product [Amoebophrya sp. A25]|eukprot:GSA25T00008700001.1
MTVLASLQKRVYTLIAEKAITDPVLSDRLAKCLGLLIKRPSDETPELDLQAIRALGFEGLPEECPELRSAYWKLTLGYLPLELEKWDSTLKEKREQYRSLVVELCSNPNLKKDLFKTLLMNTCVSSTTSETEAPSSKEKDSSTTSPSVEIDEIDIEIYDQINKDVFRTRREHSDFFGRNFSGNKVKTGAGKEGDPLRNGSNPAEAAPKHSNASNVCDILYPQNGFDAMGRVLFLYAKLNPGIRYVQGMNEILAVVYFLFASCCRVGAACIRQHRYFLMRNK